VTRLELVEKLRGEHGQPLVLLPWWREAFDALDDPGIQELILSLARQTGKSQLLAAMAISELFTKPGSYTVFLAAAANQAGAIFHRKIRRPLERVTDRGAVRFTKRGVELPGAGSALEVLATNEATVPARSASKLFIDEARDIPDEVYSALAPSVIGAGGKIVIASSAGPPRGFFYELTKNPTPQTWLYRSAVNDNPHADRGVLDFLRRRLGLFPSAARRELDNEFADDGESFLPAALIEAAIDDGLGELPSSPEPAFGFLDLSRKRDLTSLVVILRGPARRPEAKDHLVAASVRVWDPKRSPAGETDFAEVRAALDDLPRRFPRLERVLVDEGAEAGAVLPWARGQAALTLRVQVFRATQNSNMDLWGALAGRLQTRTLSIPRHERLLAELRGLRQESFAMGSQWRVVDSSRKFHRDVSLALAGACFAAGEVPDTPRIVILRFDEGPAAPPEPKTEEEQRKAQAALRELEERQERELWKREAAWTRW